MSAQQQFLTETRERFLRAVLAALPIGRVRELYLFQPIRQAGVESGVAVVAAFQEDASAVDRRPAPVPAETTSSEGTTAVVDLEDVTGDTAEADACELPPVVAATADGRRSAVDAVPEVTADGRRSAVDAVAEAPRYTVYTARYRHTLKGPDRGKWESSIVAEAEAPLLSIESVVRGVQRRSGDVDPPDHMTVAELRAALRLEPGKDAA